MVIGIPRSRYPSALSRKAKPRAMYATDHQGRDDRAGKAAIDGDGRDRLPDLGEEAGGRGVHRTAVPVLSDAMHVEDRLC